jgi:hypothetical protein
VTEISFHKELYDHDALAEAKRTYDAYASLELREEPHRWVVSIAAADEAREDRIRCELSNFALGRTIDGAKARARDDASQSAAG